MLNYPAVDVAIGLTFLFFIVALICSGINEAISSSLRWRARDVERGLWELLRDPAKTGEEATEALERLRTSRQQREFERLKRKLARVQRGSSRSPD